VISSLGNLALRNIYTRSYPSVDPLEVVKDPERLIKKKNLRESQVTNNPLLKSHSLHESFPILKDIDYDISFEFSIFSTKSESFVPEIVFDEFILKPYISAQGHVISDSGKYVVQQFENLEDLVTQLNQATQKHS